MRQSTALDLCRRAFPFREKYTRCVFLRALLVLALVTLIGVPFAMSAGGSEAALPPDTPTVVITTPHVQQIRYEFAHAFSRWHEEHFGTPVRVDYRTPGGTSEIIRGLEAQARAAIKDGLYDATTDAQGAVTGVTLRRGAVDTDILFGGGTYDHNKLGGVLDGGRPGGIDVTLPTGEKVRLYLSTPTTLAIDDPAERQAFLDDVFGENKIGPKRLYHPGRYWIGTALSSFGIVYNEPLLRDKLRMDPPTAWEDLTDPRLRTWVALADPRLSGSITTTMDTILGFEGWDDGWRILREMCGNARYFTGSSTKPPTDVSQGDAAVGLAIDFYGRGQAQTAGRGRVGYVEPAGAVHIDADPVTVLAGGPNPEIANRFVQFCLTEEAQALWQFAPVGAEAAETGELGPERYALRRMPVRRSMYAKYFDRFTDKVDPFAIASDIAEPGWRTGIMVMMGCFAIDVHSECNAAWDAIARARADDAFPPETLAAMEALFLAWPDTPVDAEGGFTLDAPTTYVPWSETTYGEVRNSWRPPGAQRAAEIYYTAFFTAAYERVERLGRSPGRPADTDALIAQCYAQAGVRR